jgi:FKBP-type peptidyl-prolyl cis-trans isomerase 2
MAIVKEGYKVNIMFEAKLETGKSVLKTEEGKPLEVVIGEGTIPKSIEKALIDMKVGDKKTIKLEPVEAFGPKINDLIIDLPKNGFGPDCNLGIGEKVSLNSKDGKEFIGIIKEIKDENITVDFNHPLAGKSLVFTVTILSIK